MKNKIISLLFIIMLLLTGCKGAKAQINVPGALDRIQLFQIVATVNDDASVSFDYHILWEVLDSSSEGPLEWVKVGVPNLSISDIDNFSDAISNVSISYDGGSYLRIDLDRSYYSGEVVTMDFSFICDNLYEMNALTDGETVYYFTPGWFDGMAVDKLEIFWNDSNALGWSSGAYQDNGYIVWEETDVVGRTSERSVTYSSDALGFDNSKTYDSGDYSDYYNFDYDYPDYYYYPDEDDSDGVIAVVIFVAAFFVVIVKILKGIAGYSDGAGFSSTEPKVTRKVTRTLIKYYPTCPGCGAVRETSQEKCEYCGRSFIESEEIVEEKAIKEPNKYNEEGLFSYGSSPDTYIRVHVTHVPAPRPPKPSCVHSSCAHSSCACAHSCACACACACAGGGRAGCSTKDFYNTGLKLKQFEKRKKH